MPLTNLAFRYKCSVPVTKGGALPSKFLLHVTLSEELTDKATCPHFMQAPWLSGMGDVGTVKHHRENLAAIKTAKNKPMQASNTYGRLTAAICVGVGTTGLQVVLAQELHNRLGRRYAF